MNKLTDLIISAILKKGIMYEARNVETDIEIPDSKIVVKVKIEHMSVKFEKDDKTDKIEA